MCVGVSVHVCHHHHYQYSFNYGMTECRPHMKNNRQNTKVHKYSVSKCNVTKRSVELELCRPSICFHITCAWEVTVRWVCRVNIITLEISFYGLNVFNQCVDSAFYLWVFWVHDRICIAVLEARHWPWSTTRPHFYGLGLESSVDIFSHTRNNKVHLHKLEEQDNK